VRFVSLVTAAAQQMHAGECSQWRVRQLEMLVGVLLLRRSTRHELVGRTTRRGSESLDAGCPLVDSIGS